MPAKSEKTEPSAVARQKPPVVDDVTVKETFADDFLGLYAVGSNFHLNFGTRRPVRNTTANSINLASFISARIVLPLEAAIELYLALGGVVDNLEKRGVVKRSPAPAPAKKE